MMILPSTLEGRIYNCDLKIIYGGVLRKLDGIIAYMKELRN
jgi:hypothetical protein